MTRALTLFTVAVVGVVISGCAAGAPIATDRPPESPGAPSPPSECQAENYDFIGRGSLNSLGILHPDRAEASSSDDAVGTFWVPEGTRLYERDDGRTEEVRIFCAVLDDGGTMSNLPVAPGWRPTTQGSTEGSDHAMASRTYAVQPGYYGWAQCEVAPATGCPSAPPHAATMIAEVTVPHDGWENILEGVLASPSGTEGPNGGGITLRWSGLTTGLHSDPCLPVSHRTPDIAVGVTVDDFIEAVVAHPTLQVTEPVDTELDGYPGRFFTLTGPSDISGCNNWRPWEPGIYVQGPDNIWHVWAIDVDGLRVILLTQEFAGTPAEVKRELAGMVDSIHFVLAP